MLGLPYSYLFVRIWNINSSSVGYLTCAIISPSLIFVRLFLQLTYLGMHILVSVGTALITELKGVQEESYSFVCVKKELQHGVQVLPPGKEQNPSRAQTIF